MKVKLNEDESWPVYSIENDSVPGLIEIELTSDECTWVNETHAEFNRVQSFLKGKVAEAGWRRFDY